MRKTDNIMCETWMILAEREAGDVKAAVGFFIGLAIGSGVMCLVLYAITHAWPGW